MTDTRDPAPWSRTALEHGGFRGFVPFSALATEEVPAEPGVYTVLRTSGEAPRFSDTSPAGRVRAKDPALPVTTLATRWVDGPEVLYVGVSGTRGLRKRLEAFRRHGAGAAADHWAGRLIWQLEDRDDLLVAWNITYEDPSVVGSRMLGDFVDRYGVLPFANLRR